MRSRVMPGSLVTIARRVPVKRLKSVDLPTLGRPTMTRDGSRSAISCSVGHTMGAAARRAIFQCSAFRVARVEEVHPRHFVSISKERAYNFAFHKCMILKEIFLAQQHRQTGKRRRLKKKSGSKPPQSKRSYLRH